MQKYWYLVVFFGFMVHFLVVFGVGKLSRYPIGWKRASAAGAIGGLHAGACLIEGFSFLAEDHWRVIGLVLMALVAFGYELSRLPWAVAFVVMLLLMDALAADPLWAFMVLCGLGILIHCVRKRIRGNIADISITHKGKQVDLRALLDTGNTLKDPISGLDVIVVDRDVAKELTGLEEAALADPIHTLTECFMPGLRLIPYKSIGQPSGLLLGLRVDKIRINGQKAQKIVALAPQLIGQGNGYQALAGGMI